ncbi:MAG TPA: SDR family oxidoreductase [Dehalococcoidia bacterium]|nr:SDR family oxidoreductase [Dehalococcoidia bacterium]HIL19784.1 SDR family oxidoreductase [Gammaproteobacteria bacterium]
MSENQMMRLENKVAIVAGASQTPGSTMGNGRAAAVLFARESAKMLAVDRDLDSANQTVEIIGNEGGCAYAFKADVTNEVTLKRAVADCMTRWNRLEVLHNNVGISVTGPGAPVTEIAVEAFDLIMAVNLRGVAMTCRHPLPVMRTQESIEN